MSDETRQKISEAHKGKKKSPEAIAKSREARKGRKLKEETKRKMGLSHKGTKNWNAKSVNQYDLKNLARNPTGFRRWDEWLGVLHG